jgi:putative ABC transport system permease protein
MTADTPHERRPDGLQHQSVVGQGVESCSAILWLWLRFSVRRVLSNPLRVAIVLLSVALATTLSSAVFRVSLASINSFERGISGGERPYQLLVSPFGGRLRQGVLAQCLRPLTPYTDMLALRREAAELTVNQRTVPVRVLGVGVFNSSGGVVSGAKRSIAPELAETLGISPGQKVILASGEHRVQVELDNESDADRFFGSADLVVALTDLAPLAVIDSVALRFNSSNPKVAHKDIIEWITSCYGGYSDINASPIRVEHVRAPIERGEKLLAAYRFNIMIMAAIALLVCVIIISQATQITVRSVHRELAIVRTLGISQTACLFMIVGEIALVSVIGAIIGVTIGAPIVVSIAGFLTNTASEIYNLSLQSTTTTSAFVRSFIIVIAMTTVGACAALLGAREVIRMAPYRGTRREQRVLRPLCASSVLAQASIASLILGILIVLLIARPAAALAYTSIAVMIAWSAACIPLLLYLAPAAVHSWRGFLSVRLAANTLKVSGRNFFLSGAAVSVSVALLVGLSLMVSSFRDTLKQWSAIRLAGDVFISSTLSGSGNEARIAPHVLRAVQELKPVKQVVPYYETGILVGTHAVVLGGVDLAIQCGRRVYSFIAGECMPPGSSWRGDALVSESAARKLGLSLNQQVSVAQRSYRVRGIIQEFGTEQPQIVINASEFEGLYEDHYPETITIDLNNSSDIDVAQTAIRAIVPATLTVRNQRELLALVETLFNRTFRVTDAVRWIVFSMALLGILSTAAQHIWERRRELRVSEVIGVSRWTLVAALTLEVAVVTCLSVFVGILGGLAIGWCLTEYINPLVFGWSLSFAVSKGPLVEAFLFVGCVAIAIPFVAKKLLKQSAGSVTLADE